MKFRSRSKSSKDSRSSSTRPEYFQAHPEQSQLSPRSVTVSTPHSSSARKPFEGTEIRVPIASDGRIIQHSEVDNPPVRSISTGRGLRPSGSMKIIGRDSRDEPTQQPRRSQSVGRGSRHQYEQSEQVDSSEHSGAEKKRKSKTEKIRQLQAKNELYKDEFKRVQKDRKKLKKELEAKNAEILSLSKEIDYHIAETSRLKSQLSDAMLRADEHERDNGALSSMGKELSQTKDELSATLRRVSELKGDISDLREYVRRKDEQLETLSNKVTSQESLIDSLTAQNVKLKEQTGDKGKREDKMVKDLVAENEQLQAELGTTLERAAKMVKEREDAIADLLRENDGMKDKIKQQEQALNEKQSIPEISQEELDELRQELESSHAQLEQVQDRNVLLEEEIEAWLSRGAEMEGMLDRLNNDLEAWQQKTKAAEDSLAVMEGQVVDAKAEAESARQALIQAEAKHKSALVDVEIKHKKAVLDIQERMKSENPERLSAESKQAMLLQQAVADRQRKSTTTQQKSWRSRFLMSGSADEEDSNSDDYQKEVKELQARNEAQEEEIKMLKSELVRLRSKYNEDSYMNKKRIERLTEENEAFAEKAAALQIQLSKALQ